ncbi:hypothetical protein SLEP1_g45803 [Rubroshorea leprosula]|uniref:Replication protein A 32 kDa subunit n=1 Tax=Rubroshorea leprosula TaxID=152421 RepID=A0AAV5LMS3_9ROSI|nr:hypothetical protein SLEP1_g45803 [Rubroshorea leprosula]
MSSNNPFDATSAFSGGGFMPSQRQPSRFADSTPSPSKGRDSQGLIPVTVKQISEASQSGDEKSNFTINGVDVTNVTVVGMLFDKKVRSFNDIRFHLDDGTGRIECIRWVTENSETRQMDEIDDGTYVRLNGHLQSFQGKRQLVAFSVRPVTNFDEVTFHYIDCIYLHLYNAKLLTQCQGGALTQPQLIESLSNTPVHTTSNGYQTPSFNNFTVDVSPDGLKGFDKLVLNYLQQPSNIEREMGVHLKEISQQLKSPIEKIKDAIEFLEKEGLVYSSIDDYHYKAVEGC